MFEKITDNNDDASQDVIFGDGIVNTKAKRKHHKSPNYMADLHKFTHEQLELSYAQVRNQARRWFQLSLSAACVGFLLFSIGVLNVVTEQSSSGLIALISSAVPNVAAALFFTQSKVADGRVDAIRVELSEIQETQLATELVETIEESAFKDKLKAEIIRRMLW